MEDQGAFKLLIKMEIDLRSEFRKAGQGCFYTAEINRGARRFSLVYDCGTFSHQNYLDEAIQDFTSYIKGALDLLVISHFDEDHVNGVADLLMRTGGCDTVVLPYLSPIERHLLSASRSDAGDPGGDGGDDDDGDRNENTDGAARQAWLSFLQNPVAFLVERKARRIIFIHGDEEGGSEGQDRRFPAPDPSDENELREEAPLELVNQLPPVSPPEGDEGGNAYGNVFHCSHHGYMRVNKLWYFRFYNEKKKEDKLAEFKDAVEKFLKKDESQKPGIEPIDLLALFSKDKRKELAEIYLHKLGEINNTSLAMYHSSFPGFKVPYCVVDKSHYASCWHMLESPVGTLLTGDLSIKEVRRLNDFINHYRTELEHVFIFQVPHHGSHLNWNGDIIPELPQARYFVINAGNGRKHHPHATVLKELLSLVHSGILLNSELKEAIFYIKHEK